MADTARGHRSRILEAGLTNIGSIGGVDLAANVGVAVGLEGMIEGGSTMTVLVDVAVRGVAVIVALLM